jgi:CcmD family protein
MSALVIIGLILAFINPVIGGVLVGYIVWLDDPVTGLQLMMLSLTVVSLYFVGFIVYIGKRIKKLENRLKELEGKS